MINCSKCGTQNRDETKYCKNCGTRLAEGSVVPCGNCGASNLATSLYCNRCGERLAPEATRASGKVSAKLTAQSARGTEAERGRPVALATQVAPTEQTNNPSEPRVDQFQDSDAPVEKVPDWLARFYETPPNQTRLIPTHDLLRMANALGIDVDYSTLRFW